MCHKITKKSDTDRSECHSLQHSSEILGGRIVIVCTPAKQMPRRDCFYAILYSRLHSRSVGVRESVSCVPKETRISSKKSLSVLFITLLFQNPLCLHRLCRIACCDFYLLEDAQSNNRIRCISSYKFQICIQ